MPWCPGGIKAKRQPFFFWLVLSCSHVSWTWSERCVRAHSDRCRKLRTRTHLLVWKRCSQALSRHHSYHPGFEVHVFLRATVFSIPPNILVERSAVLCSSRFVLCFSFVQVLCKLASVVLELLRLDEVCVPLIRNLAFVHDVLQHRLVLELFLREDVSHCKSLFLRIQERFRSSLCSSCPLLCVSLFSWSFLSISDCAPISMFVSILSTPSLRGRGFDARHLCSNCYVVHLG